MGKNRGCGSFGHASIVNVRERDGNRSLSHTTDPGLRIQGDDALDGAAADGAKSVVEALAEFVHEHAGRPQAVGSDGAEEVEDAAATIGRAVDQDFGKFVGRERGGFQRWRFALLFRIP